MRKTLGIHALSGCTIGVALCVAGAVLAAAQTPVAVDSARITITGTSNIHGYTASTSTVRVRRALIAGAADGLDVWAGALAPGGVETFEIAIPAATLTSPKDGIDKTMHKALQVVEHPDIVFRLLRLEPRGGATGSLRAVGVLQIAGVEREVALDLAIERKDGTLTVRGQLPLLMTDYGIKPPTAMLGMLKTDPKVTVAFETVLAIPTT